MSNTKINETQWERLYGFLSEHPNLYAKNEEATRLFVDAVHWRMRTGAQWRELPERFGKWNNIYRRFARWEEKGIWEQMYDYFADDVDMEYVLPDSTVVRAHASAAGATKKRWSKKPSTGT